MWDKLTTIFYSAKFKIVINTCHKVVVRFAYENSCNVDMLILYTYSVCFGCAKETKMPLGIQTAFRWRLWHPAGIHMYRLHLK